MRYFEKIIIYIIASLITISTFAQQQPAQLSTTADTLQYTLGAFVGQWIIKNNFTINNPAVFTRGMDDVFQNRPLAVNDSTIGKRIATYQLTTQNERSQQMETQLFAELKGKSGVGALPNGVHYIVVETGSGIRPTAKDSIVINAVGLFPDGTVFEDTFETKQTIFNIIT